MLLVADATAGDDEGNLASDAFKQEMFRNQDFRRAMAHLIDRQAIIELVLSGAGFPLKAGVHPSYGNWYHEELEVPEYDPQRAGELLAGIGFTRRDSDGYLIDESGRRAAFTLNLVSGVAFAEGTALLFADAAREIGVEVDVQPLAFPLLVELVTATGEDRPFEAVFIGLTPADHTWPLFEGLYSCDGSLHLYNRSGGCLSATELLISELVERGRLTIDDAEA
ncbi:MAG TPA: ABC transporter substrate-binding protein, partial [Trueperaceae bacterium]